MSRNEDCKMMTLSSQCLEVVDCADRIIFTADFLVDCCGLWWLFCYFCDQASAIYFCGFRLVCVNSVCRLNIFNMMLLELWIRYRCIFLLMQYCIRSLRKACNLCCIYIQSTCHFIQWQLAATCQLFVSQVISFGTVVLSVLRYTLGPSSCQCVGILWGSRLVSV